MCTCGVAKIGSSSSPAILASSSLSLLSLSLPSIFTLPTELLTVLRSGASEPHAPLPPKAGDSSAIEPIDIFRPGIFMALCAATGDESGSRCSASVEWCKFVEAREKSSPRECLGSDVAGLPVWLCDCIYEWMLVCSSRGLRGPVLESCVGLGICRLRPRDRKSGRRVLFGVEGTALSSLLSRRSFSRMDGEGARVVGGSERLRFFAGDLEEGECASDGGPARLLTWSMV